MSVEIKVPSMGESVVEATVAQWLKKPGDAVAAGEALVELETDKVNQEIEAPFAGVLTSIAAPEGSTVSVGALLGTIDGAGATASAPATEAAPAATETAPTTPSNGGAGKATPVAEAIATKNNVDLKDVTPTGPAGKVGKSDVEAKIATPQAPTTVTPPVAPTAPPAAPKASTDGRPVERIRISRRRATIANNLKHAQNTAAMLTTFNEVDMSRVMELRSRRKEDFEKRFGIGLGFMSFFTKAVVGALKAFPYVNGEIDDAAGEIILKKYYDIGIAVGLEEGLVVPVVRNADARSFADIEKEIKRLAGKAKEGSLSLADLTGGTFTITNGGIFGSMLSTPILNYPQVGILGMHNIVKRPVVVGDEIVVRPIMYVALSYDHRIIDGGTAVRFLVKVKELIEDPETLLLEG
ncbi:MAG: 2-oxoglutarate dehydrogenase complex dihydrolipoyllysine-residue succinyltransferase [Armatimonas sp.]